MYGLGLFLSQPTGTVALGSSVSKLAVAWSFVPTTVSYSGSICSVTRLESLMTKYMSCRSWPSETEVHSLVFKDSRIAVVQIKFYSGAIPAHQCTTVPARHDKEPAQAMDNAISPWAQVQKG